MASTEDMIDDLNGQMESLKTELIDLERTFNFKKEQYIKMQGAVEALNAVQLKEKTGDT